MSVMFLIDQETQKIDTARPVTNNRAPYVSQADDPGSDLQSMGQAHKPNLPDPSVGGENGSRFLLGFSTGFKSLFNRTQRFSGAVGVPQPVTNPVQGNVGSQNNAGRLFAGVKDQVAGYRPSTGSSYQSYVGIVTAPKAS